MPPNLLTRAALSTVALLAACATDRLEPMPDRGTPLDPRLAELIAASGENDPVAVVDVLSSETGEPIRSAISPAIAARGRAVGTGSGLERLRPSFDFQDNELLLTLHPSGQRSILFHPDTLVVIRWRLFCPQSFPPTQILNYTVEDLSQRGVAGTGSHGQSHTGAKPIAQHKHSSGQSDAQGQFFDTLTSERAAGDEVLTIRAVGHDPGPCNGVPITQEFFTATRVLDLIRITSHTNLVFNTITSDHNDIYWAIPELDNLTHTTVDNYFAAARGSLTVTAASLPFGGINDINNNWNPPHNTHRIGTDVDFDGPADNQRVWGRIRRAGVAAGFNTCDVHSQNHVHCYAIAY